MTKKIKAVGLKVVAAERGAAGSAITKVVVPLLLAVAALTGLPEDMQKQLREALTGFTEAVIQLSSAVGLVYSLYRTWRLYLKKSKDGAQ